MNEPDLTVILESDAITIVPNEAWQKMARRVVAEGHRLVCNVAKLPIGTDRLVLLGWLASAGVLEQRCSGVLDQIVGCNFLKRCGIKGAYRIIHREIRIGKRLRQ